MLMALEASRAGCSNVDLQKCDTIDADAAV